MSDDNLPSKWTEQQDAILRTRAAERVPASKIAVEVGRTRCAVIGRMRRLGIESRIAPHGVRPVGLGPRVHSRSRAGEFNFTRSKQLAEIRCAADVPAEPATLIPIEPGTDRWAALPGTDPLPLLALRDCHCRWPVGDPLLFCAAAKLDGSSYCPTHTRMGIDNQSWAKREARYFRRAA